MGHFQFFLHQSVRSGPLLGLALAASALAAEAQVVFSPPVNISNDAGKSGLQQIAIDSSGNISIVWLDNTPGYNAVFFSRSTDGGATFSSPQNLSNSQGDVGDPQIAVDSGGNIYVAWASPASNGDIFFTHSSDAGTTFSVPTIISNHPSGGARGPSMAVDSGGNVNVTWWGTFLPSFLFFSRSSDGGNTFSTPVSVSNNGEADLGQLAVDSAGNINVAWCEGNGNFQVTFSRSADGGASFTAPKIISPFASETCSKTMTLDSAGKIYVVGDLQPNSNIYLARSTDGAATFSSTNVVNNTAFVSLTGERIATDTSGNIYVVWQGPAANASAIFFSHSSDGGATFSTPQNISGLGGPGGPQIATDVWGNINVVWQDNASGNWQVYFTESSDEGVTFSRPQNLSNDTGTSGNPQIAPDLSGNVNVSWEDNTPGNDDIFFSRSAASIAATPPRWRDLHRVCDGNHQRRHQRRDHLLHDGWEYAHNFFGGLHGRAHLHPNHYFKSFGRGERLGQQLLLTVRLRTVTLTATPSLLSGFEGWTGCDSVSGNTCTVNMNSARSVTADFTLLGLL